MDTGRLTRRTFVDSGLGGPVSDLISGGTRVALREYFVTTTLGTISDAFDAADIPWDGDFVPQVSGQRGTLVEQYFHSLDFARWEDVRKLLPVYEGALDELEVAEASDSPNEQEYARRHLTKLKRCLQRDGFRWEGGRLVPPLELMTAWNVHDAVTAMNEPELNRQIARLRDSVDKDPALAVGTAKEMLETTCKAILEQRGVVVDPCWDVGELLKRTRRILKLLPDDIPDSAKGSATIKRLLSNLGQVGTGLAELRNLYGTGHGRTGKGGLSPRHARLAVGSVVTLVQFLFETHEERGSTG